MNITEQAATVLAEIDAELALADKATAGPWATKLSIGDYNVKVTNIWTNIVGKRIGAITHKNPDHESNATFIASARTVCPTALRMLKTAIEAVFECSHFWQAAAAMWGENHPLKDDELRALAARDAALTAIITQWNSK